MNAWLRRFIVIGVALLLIGAGFVIGTAARSGYATETAAVNPRVEAVPVRFQQVPTSVPAPDGGGAPELDIENLFATVYERVSPSVVSINTLLSGAANGFGEDSLLPAGGSGFVYDTEGHIITNAHVVEGAEQIEVRFLDGTIARGEVIGADPDSDIAVIQVSTDDVPAERLVPVVSGNSDALRVGQTTLAIGSPFGEEWTLTSGIISALNRSISGLADFNIGAVIQTDAAINPGNSGGPLLNIQGEVIGVNSQIVSRSGTNSGIGFAVPSNLVQRVVTELITEGRVNYSFLGISGTDMNLTFIEEFNLPNDLQGAVVSEVVGGGPAEQGGIQGASRSSIDVITAVNGEPIRNMDELLAYLANATRPEETVTMTVYRDGELLDLQVTLGARPSAQN